MSMNLAASPVPCMWTVSRDMSIKTAVHMDSHENQRYGQIMGLGDVHKASTS